jgi:hypothetical protein
MATVLCRQRIAVLCRVDTDDCLRLPSLKKLYNKICHYLRYGSIVSRADANTSSACGCSFVSSHLNVSSHLDR